MPLKDVTNDFRRLVEEKEKEIPPAKRRKVSSHANEGPDGVSSDKPYLEEAHNILNHIRTLTRMLATIQVPYLNVDSRSTPLSRQHTQKIDFTDASSSWANIRHLTNEERDQIDLQAKVILMRCSDRVKEMELVEKKRAQLVAGKTNAITRFLPARLRQEDTNLSSEVLAAHHASIIWYLSRRLAEASQTQKEMQEERIKRQLERNKSLGSHVGQDTLAPRTRSSSSHSSGSQARAPGGWFAGNPSPTRPSPPHVDPSVASEDDDDDDMELSASQIMQFEAENANILRTVQNTLESVQQAESRLMDISALQMELVSQLTRQTEITDQLYEDALAATSTVEKGNEQLKEAKRRAKDGRLFILVFLVGASFSLLFLHYY